ncbi:MAG TPA: ARMT1-like domain-containing protein [archaeon]|nr:ARMT1-like domain-containing protein [archaeon]
MKTYPDCIPCFIRQSIDAARLVSDDPDFHEKILRRALKMAAEIDYSLPPPAMGRNLHRHLRELSAVSDPYREAKVRSNQYVLGILPELKKHLAQARDPFETALRLAMAGNVIDFGVKATLTESEIQGTIHQALTAHLDHQETAELFKQALRDSGAILYIGDNAGEIVFDRLFIETMQEMFGPLDLTFVVRGAPILNDATLEDAIQAGIDKVVTRVITNGDDAPGCLLEDCSEEFHRHLAKSDVVIAKGQGNFETLSEIPNEIYFLLKAKCQVIASDIGAKQGDLLFVRKPPGSKGT